MPGNMIHDPMCPMPDSRFMSATCQCDLIARVRADERVAAEIHNYHMPAWTAGYEKGCADERERAAERVLAAGATRGTKHTPIPPMWLTAAAAARGGEA